MAEGRGELEVYNHWFAVADLDRDGVLSGVEAVAFFRRSGLPQNPTLFKAGRAWECGEAWGRLGSRGQLAIWLANRLSAWRKPVAAGFVATAPAVVA